ncbi:hypothetical protein [Vibrio variabilis]|uniref:hypothetical protein n=1 Tax=Vibrio variabilis TaxID=990271 RepID=UPI000DDAE63B|nr:hypothetical protein [Vibrio variabilis]
MKVYDVVSYAPQTINRTADVVEKLADPDSLSITKDKMSKYVGYAGQYAQDGMGFAVDTVKDTALATQRLYDATSSTVNFYNERSKASSYQPGSIISLSV